MAGSETSVDRQAVDGEQVGAAQVDVATSVDADALGGGVITAGRIDGTDEGIGAEGHISGGGQADILAWVFDQQFRPGGHGAGGSAAGQHPGHVQITARIDVDAGRLADDSAVERSICTALDGNAVLGVQGRVGEVAVGLLGGRFEGARGGEDGLLAGDGLGLVGDDILHGLDRRLHGDFFVVGAGFPDIVALAGGLEAQGLAWELDVGYKRLPVPILFDGLFPCIFRETHLVINTRI